MSNQTNAENAWTFLATLEDEDVGDGGFQEALLINTWQATHVFTVHGATVTSTARLFRMVMEELRRCTQTPELIAATTMVVEAAKDMCSQEEGTQAQVTSWKNMKTLLAKTLIVAEVATWWGDKAEEQNDEDSKPERMANTVEFKKVEGLTGINPVALFQKYLKYGQEDHEEEDEEENEEEEEGPNGKAKGKKPKKEPMPMELASLIPKRAADSISIVPLEGIGIIRALTDKQMKATFKKFKLQKGLPKFGTNPDVLTVLHDAGYDKNAIAEARKQLGVMSKKYTRMRQEVNASLKVAKDILQCVVAMGKTDGTQVSLEERQAMETRALLLAGIQGQRLVSYATQCADDFAKSIGISTAGLKLRELITDLEPMSTQDKHEFLDEMVRLGKLAKAAQGCGKRKHDYASGGGYGGGQWGGSQGYQGGKGGGKGDGKGKGKGGYGGGKSTNTNTYEKQKW